MCIVKRITSCTLYHRSDV